MESPNPQFCTRFERISFESNARMAVLALRPDPARNWTGNPARFEIFTSGHALALPLSIEAVKREMQVSREEFQGWATAYAEFLKEETT